MHAFNQFSETPGGQFSICPISIGDEEASRIIFPEKSRCTIIWFTKGEGSMVTQGKSYVAQVGKVYTAYRGQVSEVILQNGSEGYIFSIPVELLYVGSAGFNMAVFVTNQDFFNEPFSIPIDGETFSDIEDVVKRILREFAALVPANEEITMQLLRIFLLYVSRKISIQETEMKWARELQLVKEFKELLARSISEKKMVSDYANALNISPGYLNLVVKKISGFTASYHIQQQVVEEAKRRVMSTGLSMKEIAYSLGFDDSAHFSKFFKIYSGINFTNFKKAIAG